MSTPISSASTASTAASPSTVISSQGVGSGLDIAAIVTSLTSAKAAPLTNAINRSNTALNAQVSAWGTFNSAVATFQATLTALQDPAQLAGRTATLGDTTIATATATSAAVTGQYSIAVQNLATAASLSSAPNSAGANAVVGTGTLQISLGGVQDSISIDSTDNTLQGIAAAINGSAGNPGVTASILTTSEGARLVLTGTKTGAANGILVTQSGGDGGLSSLVYDPANNDTTLTQTQAPQDANFTVNGYAATSASNQVSSVVSGVTLNLLKASAATAGTPPTYTPTTLTIGNDTAGAQTSIGTFVSALNGLLSSIQSLASYDPATRTAGPLLGNATIQSFQSQLSKILGQVNSSITGGPNSLAAIGIGANAQGTYSSNSATLGNALTGNLDSVSKLLSGPNGIATQLNTFVTQYSEPGGLLDTISTGLKTSLSNNAKQLADLNARMTVYSATLTAEYNAMDTAVALLKQTQTYLTQQFNQGSSSGSTSSSSALGSGTTNTGS
ncbi:MAG TPA: flagellar filament capping protein FliD [Steroidobacteraceae bacterium]|nr:flagellar filament capping protein FliD [Steroidobacteraceae bacterium]